MTSHEPPSDDVAEQVLALLRDRTEHDVRLDDPLALLDIDSVATAELSLQIETSFHCRVDEEIMDVRTVADLVDYVRQRQHAAKTDKVLIRAVQENATAETQTARGLSGLGVFSAKKSSHSS